MPVIILEGIDGSGKSTFADLLETFVPEGYNIIRAHQGPLNGTVFDEYVKPLVKITKEDFLIADRWHIGEMIYGPIYRGSSKVGPYEHGLLESLLFSIGAAKVVMSPGISTVRKRLGDRGEDFLMAEHLKQVYDFYVQYAVDNGYEILARGTKADAKRLVQFAVENGN